MSSPPANFNYPFIVTYAVGNQQRTITVTRIGGIRMQ